MAEAAAEDFNEPILPGKGASDYERYLRTDDLLSLRRRPGRWPTGTSCSSRRPISRPSSG